MSVRVRPTVRFRPVLTLAAVTLALVTACGQPHTPRADPPVAPGMPAPSAEENLGVASAGAAASAAASGTSAPVVIETRREFAQVVLPSKNIGCGIAADGVRCDIAQRAWAPPPRPASCPTEYGEFGQGLIVDQRHVDWVCAGDSGVIPSSEVLAYGHGIRVGTFVCESSPAGVRCYSETTKHGFTLAREKYTIF